MDFLFFMRNHGFLQLYLRAHGLDLNFLLRDLGLLLLPLFARISYLVDLGLRVRYDLFNLFGESCPFSCDTSIRVLIRLLRGVHLSFHHLFHLGGTG